MWRVSDERVQLDLDGPSVEVEPCRSWMIQFECLTLIGKLKAASDGSPEEYVALSNLYEYVVHEAMPSWNIIDHHGPVPTTARGMARLPTELAFQITNAWIETLNAKPEREALPPDLHIVESDAPSAVDALVPPGPLNREIKKRLRAARAA